MSKKEEKFLKIEVSTLAALFKGIKPIQNKITSILEDHYSSRYTITDPLLLSYMEVIVSCMMLENSLGSLLDQAIEAESTTLLMKPEEVVLLSTMVTSIEAIKTVSASACGISLMEH